MTLPYATVSQVDGNLALTPEQTDSICHVVGYCTTLPTNTMSAFTSIAALVATAGKGPGVEAAAVQIVQNGAVYLTNPVSDVAGAIGTPSYTGTSPAITATGTPNDDYRIRVLVTTAGAVGTSQVQISLDGGNTYGAPVATAATLVLANTGVTLDFAVGTYNKGDIAAIDCQAPYFSPTNFTTTANAALADPLKREWGTMLVAGKAQGVSDAAKMTACEAMAAAAGAFRASALSTKTRPFRVVVEAPDVAVAAMPVPFVSLVDAGVLVTGCPMDVMSPIDQLVQKRPGGAEYCARIGSITVQKHPGEVMQGKGKGGPLPSRVKAIYFTNDDDITTLDTARFITVRTLVNKSGFFFTRGPTMDAVGQWESEHQFCRVQDLATKVMRNVLANWLNADLSLKTDGSGQLTTTQAEAIDTDIAASLRAALVNTGYVIAAIGKVDRTIDVLHTKSLSGNTGILPKGYSEFISWDVGFTASA